MRFIRLIASLCAAMLCCGIPVHAVELPIEPGASRPDVPLNEEVRRVQVDRGGINLVVTLMFPDDTPGPFPLAVVNHGANGKEPPAKQPRNHETFAAYYFLSRGYAVALPMMRGYAGSDGRLGAYGCEMRGLGLDAAHDIRAVIQNVVKDPRIDPSRIVVAGQSFGGWNTLAFGTLSVTGVRGLINFNGGVQSPQCDRTRETLVKVAEIYGSQTSVPSIWFYGQNDKLFDRDMSRAMFTAYLAHGGESTYVDTGRIFGDSHLMLNYPDMLGRWVPKLDGFLEHIGLPHTLAFKGYLPPPFPPPSNFAVIDAVDKVPYLDDKGRDSYRSFLAHPQPRIFMLNPKGDNVVSGGGGFDPLSRITRVCLKVGHACRPYAINDDVVWQPLPTAPPPSHFAKLDDGHALPFAGPHTAENYARFLSRPSPRALVLSPDGKSYGVYGKQAYAQAMLNCEAQSKGCAAYVVDDDVVWVKGK